MNVETVEVVITPIRESFYNEDSNWGSYRIESLDFIPYFKNNMGINNNVVYEGGISGNMQRLDLGSPYRVVGTMKYHNRYGWNIEPTTVLPDVPKSLKQQQQFLESIITQRQANTLLEHYPNIVEDVMNDNINIDFSILKGITENNFQDIKIKICDNFVISDVLAMLSPLGVTFAMIKKLANHEKNPVLLKQKLIENPYILTSIKGLGFKKIDGLALTLNPDFRISKFRAIAYIKYRLKEIGDDEGHVWIYYITLRENFCNNVPECEEFFDIIINEEKENSTFLHVENNNIGLKSRYEIEINIYKRLVGICNTNNNYNITEDNIENGINNANISQGFEYDEEQKSIIKEAIRKKVIVLSGLAGTSKTTISRGILNIYKDANMSIQCCALSAKAKKVIEESTGFGASTIHKLFGIGVSKNKEIEKEINNDNYITTNVLMIDESSMINSYLFNFVLSHIQDDTILIIVGDDKQLPPIGYGSVLRDLLTNKENFQNINKNIYIKHLTKIYRQANKSGIIHDANIIRTNKKPFDKLKNKMVSGEIKDMFYIFNNDKEILHQEVIDKYISSINKNSIDDVIILCPINRNSINSSSVFNEEIQDLLIDDSNPFLKFGTIKYKLGAKVMQIVNDYDNNIMNGEEGCITSIEEKGCYIKFDNKNIYYSKSQLSNIQLSYCISCHKCISEDTLLYTNKGIIPIKYLNNGAQIGEFKKIENNDIKVFNGEYMEKPTYFYNNGIDKCYDIITKYGYHISVTDEHKCYVLNNNGYIDIKFGKDITIGDTLLLQKNINTFGNLIEIPKEIYKFKNDIRTNINFTLPKVLTKELSLFLGMIIADGCLFKKHRGIRYAKKSIECVEKFSELCFKIFGYHSEIKRNDKYNVYMFEIFSSYISKFIYNIGGTHPNEKYVPDCIMNTTKENQCYFLKGLFEDGSVNVKNGNIDHIELSLKDERVINQVHLLLLNLGVVSSKKQFSHTIKNKIYHKHIIYIYGEYIGKFKQLIGFISYHKLKILNDYELPKYNKLIYPNIYKIIESIYNKYPTIRNKKIFLRKNRYNTTQYLLNNFIEYIKSIDKNNTIANDSNFIYLEKLSKNFTPQEVINITESRKQTYCLTMSDNHKFVQNGFLMGNSQGSGYKIVICVMDNSSYKLLDSCLLYTALTRAKERCMLVSTPFAFEQCIRTNNQINRQTYLNIFLQNK